MENNNWLTLRQAQKIMLSGTKKQITFLFWGKGGGGTNDKMNLLFSTSLVDMHNTETV